MDESIKKSGRVLVNAVLVTEELLVKAQAQQVKSDRRLTEILVLLGVNAEAIRQALATRLKIPEIGLHNHNGEKELVELIPENWVLKHSIVQSDVFAGTYRPISLQDAIKRRFN